MSPRPYYLRVTDQGYRDVNCSFCARHNREVHMVGSAAGVIICSVCVESAAETLDRDTGVAAPTSGWRDRWPHKDL